MSGLSWNSVQYMEFENESFTRNNEYITLYIISVSEENTTCSLHENHACLRASLRNEEF